MKTLLITLALCMPAMAADNKEQQQESDCGDKYTMYTHPDKHCREQLAKEYKALVTELLKRHKATQPNPTGEDHEPSR